MRLEHGIEQSPKQISDPCHSEHSEESAFSTFHQGAPL